MNAEPGQALRQTLFVPPVPLIVAQSLGMLSASGADVVTTLTRSSNDQRDQLMSGEQDLAVTAIDNLIIWNDGGCDIRMVAQVERTTALGLYADARLGGLGDLSGTRFAVDAAGNGFAVAARYLLAAAKVEGVAFIEVGGVRERLDALRAGDVDATLLGPPLDEFAEESGFVKLAEVNSLVPDFPGQGLMVRHSRTVELGDRLYRYLGALQSAVAWTNGAGDTDGHDLLTRHGFAGRAAQTAWQTRPRTLVPSAAGIDVLVAMRRHLGLLPAGFDDMGTEAGRAALIDPAPLTRAG